MKTFIVETAAKGRRQYRVDSVQMDNDGRGLALVIDGEVAGRINDVQAWWIPEARGGNDAERT